MPIFYYQALNAERQPVSGELEAGTVQDAISQLESRGFTLQSIGLAPPVPTPATKPAGTASASTGKLVESDFLRAHLTTVFERGKSLIPALRAFSKEVGAGARRRELDALIRILERGDANEGEKAFARLPEYWIPLLSAALSSNDPGRVLQQFIKESQRSDELRRQWKLTLSYPIFVVLIAGTVLTLLSVVVIPSFRTIFLDFNMQLPDITLVNLAIAKLIAHSWVYALIACVVLLAALAFLSNSWPLKDLGVSRGPLSFIGRSRAIARTSQFMADLLEAGLPVPETLCLAGQLTNRKKLREALGALSDQLQQNAKLAIYLKAPARMATVFHAMRAEIPTTSRIRLLREISQSYTEKSRLRLSWTRGVIEPVTIILIGFIVGIVVFSLFLPLIKLINGLA